MDYQNKYKTKSGKSIFRIKYNNTEVKYIKTKQKSGTLTTVYKRPFLLKFLPGYSGITRSYLKKKNTNEIYEESDFIYEGDTYVLYQEFQNGYTKESDSYSFTEFTVNGDKKYQKDTSGNLVYNSTRYYGNLTDQETSIQFTLDGNQISGNGSYAWGVYPRSTLISYSITPSFNIGITSATYKITSSPLGNTVGSTKTVTNGIAATGYRYGDVVSITYVIASNYEKISGSTSITVTGNMTNSAAGAEYRTFTVIKGVGTTAVITYTNTSGSSVSASLSSSDSSGSYKAKIGTTLSITPTVLSAYTTYSKYSSFTSGVAKTYVMTSDNSITLKLYKTVATNQADTYTVSTNNTSTKTTTFSWPSSVSSVKVSFSFGGGGTSVSMTLVGGTTTIYSTSTTSSFSNLTISSSKYSSVSVGSSSKITISGGMAGVTHKFTAIITHTVQSTVYA